MGLFKPYFSAFPQLPAHLTPPNPPAQHQTATPVIINQATIVVDVLPIKISPFPEMGITKIKKDPQFVLIKQANVDVPVLSVHGYFVKELRTKTPLLDKNSQDILSIGSLTKLMTVVVAQDILATSTKITITPGIIATPGESGFVEGEIFSAGDLTKASLISSVNDAAFALAKESSKDFVFLMNAKANAIGMSTSNFSDPTGLDDELNFSTASDIALLAEHILNNYGGLSKITIILADKIISQNKKLTHALYNTNPLIEATSSPIFLLSKTGTTERAKECAVLITEINGGQFLIVLLGSDDRWSDISKIISWLSQTYSIEMR